ncbi:ATP-dependent DNA ligase [Micromonospora sp. C28SCA-DRY-2]|uniref:ATP-dependent DNA ligase n=1 Tax=Micromonospora sp. C28SCA-DRY-2 TaxID=3059522 RepID=UPI00267741FF|nr:ATP-dependent DNA ligase [Micromonospora sp. C28SCA-DRY-2]MDO3702082.1 ATP-dependent DNA ligase [Micromonospora sp. C28SCA-DRY-2]
MLAVAVDAVPEGAGLAYEPKWDGWRALAFRSAAGVHLQSRAGRDLSTYFPDITRAVRAAVPPGVVLDGELVAWERERTNFALLQRRVTAGRQLLATARRHPAHYVVFDVLSAPPGGPLLDVPLADRRALLVDLLAGAPPAITLSPQTTDVAQAAEWLGSWTAAGVEGVMIKELGGRYEAGRRGWRKFRAYCTTEAVIGGVTGTIDAPESALVGRLDRRGRLRYTGRTHPLGEGQRRELSALLTPPRARRPGGPVTHPWPQPLPAAWSGQLDRPEPLRYTQVEPIVVAEIEVDTAYEHHRWRHGVRYLRPRLDLSAHDVPLLLDEPG